MPVGFKNGTDGSLQIAIDAMGAAMRPHSFIGIDQDGVTSIVRTAGNPSGHVVLRGGRLRTNYDAESIREAEEQLAKHGLPPVLMVDCSHANSGKQSARQEDVWRSVIEQRAAGTRSLIGLMVESYLQEGTQPFPERPGQLALWRFHHRRLYGLGSDRANAALGPSGGRLVKPISSPHKRGERRRGRRGR